MQFFADTPVLVAAYRHVLQILQPVKHYAYHNIGHTLDVFRRVRQLSEAENIPHPEQVNILLAALFHDTGFIESYSKNEEIGARIAREWLKTQNYPEEEIQKVERLIMATVPFSPTETLEDKIIQDADMDNFGREDCFRKMRKVEAELRSIAKLDTEAIYSIFQRLFRGYQFQTPTAISQRQEKKQRNAEVFEAIYEEAMQKISK